MCEELRLIGASLLIKSKHAVAARDGDGALHRSPLWSHD
jgi:hypothetical protein